MNNLSRLFLSILSVGLLVGCNGENKEKNVEQTEKKPLVRVETVTSKDVDQTREFTATVEANISNNIAPQSPVRIENIFVEVGDRVRKGQKLVQMDNSNLKQIKTQLENQKIEFKRIDELYKIGGTSKSSWDASKMNLDVLETNYNNLMVNTQLTSPIDGIITARNYDKGDLYSASKPVLVVEQITPVKLMINVSEAYFAYVKKGMSVDIKLDVYNDETFEGKVSLVYPTIDANTRTFPVEITINNKDQRVRPGMFARAVMSFGTLNHVVVPDLAIIKQSGAGDRYVYILNDDNTVSYNKVELGRRMGDTYELISGVENGAKVVVAGQSRLTNGASVEVENK
ncbi:MAG: efflux RND transporter periplasmic adaptor subunit [Bacteroidales bacterium]|nr:efflux RND transporter periplasmic adaptor subunit [Bacteroidales bacterium]